MSHDAHGWPHRRRAVQAQRRAAAAAKPQSSKPWPPLPRLGPQALLVKGSALPGLHHLPAVKAALARSQTESNVTQYLE